EVSFAEEQIWLLDRLVPGSPAYNIMDVVELRGPYDARAMRSALRALHARHDVLRTAFPHQHGRIAPILLAEVEIAFAERDLQAAPPAEREREWTRLVREEGRRCFDLAQAPLLRATLVRMSPDAQRLL